MRMAYRQRRRLGSHSALCCFIILLIALLVLLNSLFLYAIFMVVYLGFRKHIHIEVEFLLYMELYSILNVNLVNCIFFEQRVPVGQRTPLCQPSPEAVR